MIWTKTLGVDPSITAVGYVILGGRSEVLDYGTLRPKGNDIERLTKIFGFFQEKIREHEPGMMAMEDQFLKKLKTGEGNFPSICKLIRAAQTAVCAAISENIDVRMVNARSWQSSIGIPFGASREEVKAISKGIASMTIQKPTYDVSDAYNIGYYAQNCALLETNSG